MNLYKEEWCDMIIYDMICYIMWCFGCFCKIYIVYRFSQCWLSSEIDSLFMNRSSNGKNKHLSSPSVSDENLTCRSSSDVFFCTMLCLQLLSWQRLEGIATIVTRWCLSPEIRIIFLNRKGKVNVKGEWRHIPDNSCWVLQLVVTGFRAVEGTAPKGKRRVRQNGHTLKNIGICSFCWPGGPTFNKHN